MNEQEIVEALKQLANQVPGFWEVLAGDYARYHGAFGVFWLLASGAMLWCGVRMARRGFGAPRGDDGAWTDDSITLFVVGVTVAVLGGILLTSVCIPHSAAAIAPNYMMLKGLVG